MKKTLVIVVALLMCLVVGTAMAAGDWFCTNCGKLNDGNFCGNCGTARNVELTWSSIRAEGWKGDGGCFNSNDEFTFDFENLVVRYHFSTDRKTVDEEYPIILIDDSTCYVPQFRQGTPVQAVLRLQKDGRILVQLTQDYYVRLTVANVNNNNYFVNDSPWK